MPQQPATSFADDLAKARAAFESDLAKSRGPKPAASHQVAGPDMPSLDEYGRDVQNESRESLDAGRAFVAPALSGIAAAATGGASIPVQMLVRGAAGAAGSAVRGESPMAMAGNGAVDALLSGAGGLIAKGATNAMRLSKPVITLASDGTKTVAPGPAAGIVRKMVPFGLGRNVGALGELAGGTADTMNHAIYRGAQAVAPVARTLPQMSEVVRALILSHLQGGTK